MMFSEPESPSSEESYQPGVSPNTFDALRSAIRLVLRAGIARASEGAATEGLGVDNQVRSLASGAHILGIRAEQLLILMKETWLSLPEARALDTAVPGGPHLSRLITLVLDEFYRVRPERAD